MTDAEKIAKLTAELKAMLIIAELMAHPKGRKSDICWGTGVIPGIRQTLKECEA